MDKISDEYIALISKNWNSFKSNIPKIDGIIEDISNCRSDSSKSILISYAKKLFENMIQTGVFSQEAKDTE